MAGTSSIFGARVRTDPSPARHSEKTSAFLRRVSGEAWDRVRGMLDDWVSHYPAGARSALLGRLRSPSDADFDSAFWELYLHEMYRRGGWRVVVEPKLPSTNARPDFLVTRGDSSYFVEARCIGQQSQDKGAQLRLQRVFDALDDLDTGSFTLGVTVRRTGPGLPSVKALKRDLEGWLRDMEVLDPSLRHKRWEWNADGWDLKFEPVPLTREATSKPGRRALGMFVLPGAFIDDVTPLKRALAEKGSKYGPLPHPLIIAVNISNGFHDAEDTHQALYGANGWRPAVGTVMHSVYPPGYWGQQGTPEHTHVSGVLVASPMHYARVARYAPTFWPHPEAQQAVAPLPLWPIATGDTETQLTEPQQGPNAYFGVGEEWPGELFPRS